MKISVKTTNIQSIRKTLEKSEVKKYLELKNENSRVLVWNFWYIISPNNSQKSVRKYFIKHEYYLKELENYNLVWETKINIPNIIWHWKELIKNNTFFYIDFENIRYYKKSFWNILEIEPREIWKIIWEIHKINYNFWKAYIHWNLHESNFFLNNKKELWIFDFTSMHYDDIEYDFATIYLNSNYNDDFLNIILSSYCFKADFSYKKMLIHTILKVRENIKWCISMSKKQKEYLKLDLLNLKNKLLKIS